MVDIVDGPIDKLADKTVSKLRTVLPAVWGVIVGQVIVWLVAHEWIPDVAIGWQGAVTGATVTVITGISVWAVYSFARWVEARKSRTSQFIATMLLCVLSEPHYLIPVSVVTAPADGVVDDPPGRHAAVEDNA